MLTLTDADLTLAENCEAVRWHYLLDRAGVPPVARSAPLVPCGELPCGCPVGGRGGCPECAPEQAIGESGYTAAHPDFYGEPAPAVVYEGRKAKRWALRAGGIFAALAAAAFIVLMLLAAATIGWSVAA